MERNKILEIAQSDKNKGLEYEQKVTKMGFAWGMLLSFCVALVMVMIEYIVDDTINYGIVTIVMMISGVQSFYEGITLKKKYMTILGTIKTILAILFVILYVYRVVAK